MSSEVDQPSACDWQAATVAKSSWWKLTSVPPRRSLKRTVTSVVGVSVLLARTQAWVKESRSGSRISR